MRDRSRPAESNHKRLAKGFYPRLLLLPGRSFRDRRMSRHRRVLHLDSMSHQKGLESCFNRGTQFSYVIIASTTIQHNFMHCHPLLLLRSAILTVLDPVNRGCFCNRRGEWELRLSSACSICSPSPPIEIESAISPFICHDHVHAERIQQ